MHWEGGKNIHYEGHGHLDHSRIQWPVSAEEESVARRDDDHFEHDFVDVMRRDHDILAKHFAHEDRPLNYEDPHLHAPLSEHCDHDPIIDEHRPSDEDFYMFEWSSDRGAIDPEI